MASIGWLYFFRPLLFPPNLRKLFNRSNSAYAIVTGGSKGIGIEIARLLAKQGFNLILVARNEEDLKHARNDLLVQFPGRDILTFSMDASRATSEEYEQLFRFMDGKDISILINNVGVHNDIPQYVDEMSSEEVNRIIAVNCTYQVVLTSKVIPLLKLSTRNNLGGRALIMNISSLTSKMAMPLLTCYAATKSFEEHFSVGLAAELDPFNIDVLCLRPGLTVSKMSGISTPSMFIPSAATMASSCLRMISTDSGKINASAPYFPHFILDVINGVVPAKWTWAIVRKMHEDKRKEKLQ
jgi:short-subunit dehydrogenase